MWGVIALLYGGNIGCDSPSSLLDTVAHLFKLEQQLVDWQHALPPTLGLRNSQDIPMENPGTNEKFRVILTLRYHNLRILLHRTMLVRFLNTIGGDILDNQEAPLLQQVGINSVQICIQSSVEIISLVSGIVKYGDNKRKMLGAWWFSLYYTFNAALVLCASFIIYRSGTIPESARIIPSERLRICIDEASRTLELLDMENQTINTCAKYLRQLAAVLDILGTMGSRRSEWVWAWGN
ncbi:hypothetical protein LAWI1_G001220 [Lachnellula willkommii]|uniref:Uncharacterized protein n=1 Tax=Lachnellula willkommii TaxID=215461 RepID=A0A559MF02_9HELO|nr:hypothetical protein LAWI1_G001220 [Lachnellula willkommii]